MDWKNSSLLSALFLLYYIDEVESLYQHKNENLTTDIFVGCFIFAIILIVLYHCWLKRQPLHKVDWDEGCDLNCHSDEQLTASNQSVTEFQDQENHDLDRKFFRQFVIDI